MTRKRTRPRIRATKPKSPVTLANPTTWDKGAAGPANRVNLREEAATDIDPETGRETANPNGVRRFRRETRVQALHRQGKLTVSQFAAACALYDASVGNRDKDPLAALGDVKQRGGDPIVAAIDRRRMFREMRARIPASSWPVVERVVIQDKPIWHGDNATRGRHIARLQAGLDALA